MKTFLIVSLGILVLALPFIGIYLVENWKRLIWENKGRIFRIRTDGSYWEKDKPFWVVEKRFLWFFVNCSEILNSSQFFTKEEAMESLSTYLRKLDEIQNPKSFIVDCTNLISDPTRQIESKKLKTKRIKCEGENNL